MLWYLIGVGSGALACGLLALLLTCGQRRVPVRTVMPLAVLASGVLWCSPDDPDPEGVVLALRDALQGLYPQALLTQVGTDTYGLIRVGRN
jgi:hypothetical protein